MYVDEPEILVPESVVDKLEETGHDTSRERLEVEARDVKLAYLSHMRENQEDPVVETYRNAHLSLLEEEYSSREGLVVGSVEHDAYDPSERVGNEPESRWPEVFVTSYVFSAIGGIATYASAVDEAASGLGGVEEAALVYGVPGAVAAAAGTQLASFGKPLTGVSNGAKVADPGEGSEEIDQSREDRIWEHVKKGVGDASNASLHWTTAAGAAKAGLESGSAGLAAGSAVAAAAAAIGSAHTKNAYTETSRIVEETKNYLDTLYGES